MLCVITYRLIRNWSIFLRHSLSWLMALDTYDFEMPFSVRKVATICTKQKQLDAISNYSGLQQMKRLTLMQVLCSVHRASLYNLVNKANLMQNLFLVYLSISTCFGRLCAHHQEKQLCLCDNCYLLFCVDDWVICRVDGQPHRITSTKCRINIVVSPNDGHIVARNMYRLIDILRINCAPSWFYLQDWCRYSKGKGFT